MAATISKLILVRRKDVNPDLFKDAPFAKFITGEPIPVQPYDPSWSDEAGYTHYAYPVGGMKLKDYEALIDYYENPTTVEMLIIDYVTQSRTLKVNNKTIEGRKLTKPEEILDHTLAQGGLKVCEVALEDVD